MSTWPAPSWSVAAPPQLTVSGAKPACGVIVSPAADGLRLACTTTDSGALVTVPPSLPSETVTVTVRVAAAR